VLFLIVLMGLALAAVGQVWRVASQRDKEAELLFLGDQFRRAFQSYYDSSPGAKEFPHSLEELIEDSRFPTAKRHLRKVFVDPMTGMPDWGLVRLNDRLVGVFSKSKDEPLKQAGLPVWLAAGENAKTYTDWVFAYNATADGATPAPGDSGAATIQPAVPAPAPVQGAMPQVPQPIAPSELGPAQKRACDLQQRQDAEVCKRVARDQPGIEARQCEASRAARYDACLQFYIDGSEIPPLYQPGRG
jgi:type II secretory pathway pseudopilin PulG